MRVQTPAALCGLTCRDSWRVLRCRALWCWQWSTQTGLPAPCTWRVQVKTCRSLNETQKGITAKAGSLVRNGKFFSGQRCDLHGSHRNIV